MPTSDVILEADIADEIRVFLDCLSDNPALTKTERESAQYYRQLLDPQS